MMTRVTTQDWTTLTVNRPQKRAMVECDDEEPLPRGQIKTEEKSPARSSQRQPPKKARKLDTAEVQRQKAAETQRQMVRLADFQERQEAEANRRRTKIANLRIQAAHIDHVRTQYDAAADNDDRRDVLDRDGFDSHHQLEERYQRLRYQIRYLNKPDLYEHSGGDTKGGTGFILHKATKPRTGKRS